MNNFDKFADKLKKCEVDYVHPIKEHSWEQATFVDVTDGVVI